MGDPTVVAIVLNWRLAGATVQVAEDLRVCEYPSLQVLLIDNGSGDGSAERLREVEGCDVLAFDDNLGYCAAMNRGVAWAHERGAEYALFLNNDVRLPPEFLEPLALVLAGDPTVACVGPTVLRPDGKAWSQGAEVRFMPNLVTLRGQGREPLPTTHGPEEVDFLPGACALYRLEYLDAVGGLDEDYFMYWEDADVGRRLRLQGYKNIWLPWVRVEHDASRSSGGGRSPLRKYMSAVNLVRYLRVHGTLRLWCAFALFEVLLWPLALVSGTGVRAAIAKARGIIAGIFGRKVTAADAARFRQG